VGVPGGGEGEGEETCVFSEHDLHLAMNVSTPFGCACSHSSLSTEGLSWLKSQSASLATSSNLVLFAARCANCCHMGRSCGRMGARAGGNPAAVSWGNRDGAPAPIAASCRRRAVRGVA